MADSITSSPVTGRIFYSSRKAVVSACMPSKNQWHSWQQLQCAHHNHLGPFSKTTRTYTLSQSQSHPQTLFLYSRTYATDQPQYDHHVKICQKKLVSYVPLKSHC